MRCEVPPFEYAGAWEPAGGVTRDLAGCGSYRRRGGEVRLDNLFDGINLPDCGSLCQKIIHLEYFH